MKIKINNWSRWNNKRSEHSRCHWLKLDHFFVTKCKYHGLTNDEAMIWIDLLCEASRTNSELIVKSPRTMCELHRTTHELLMSAMRKLKDIGWLSFHRTVLDKKRREKIREEKSRTTSAEKNTERNEPSQATFVNPTDLVSFGSFYRIKNETLELWKATYQNEDWVIQELNKGRIWISANPTRAPKSNFSRFFSSWLSRSWEYSRKNGSKNKELDWDQFWKGKENVEDRI